MYWRYRNGNFAYGRVSTKDQTAENQRLEIERGLHRGLLVRGSGVSGKTSASQRPEFAKMLGQIHGVTCPASTAQPRISGVLLHLERCPALAGSTLVSTEPRRAIRCCLRLV